MICSYSDKDLAEGWEFKIVRSGFAIFRKPEALRELLEEEKKGGWILVEKFSDAAIRLKRPAGMKTVEGDFADGYDPYRSYVRSPLEREVAQAIDRIRAALLRAIRPS